MYTKNILFNGKSLFYRSAGKGPLVVLLHGFGEDGEIWKGQFDLFPNHTLVVPDLPGTGRSEGIDDMSMEGLAEAVKAMIDAEGGKDAFVSLIGHSMGGYITLAFAEKYPERLNSFGLFHSSAFADSNEKKETRQKAIRFITERGATEFLKTATPNLYAPETKEQHPEWIAEHLALGHNFFPENLVSYYRSMIERPDRTNVLKRSRVPVLFVMGQHDVAVPLEDGLKQCYLPQIAYIHVLRNSGHMGMIEEKDLTDKILSQFVITTEKTVLT